MVKWSVARRIKRFPRGVSGSGPRKSVEMRSSGAPTCIFPKGARGVRHGALMDAHISHFRIHI